MFEIFGFYALFLIDFSNALSMCVCRPGPVGI
jgi:hypothetical protein